MFSTILKLIKPTYAIAALLVLGVFQGVVTLEKGPRLKSMLGQQEESSETTESAVTGDSDESVLTRIIASYHPAKRLIVWLLCYTLACLALVPGIQIVLEGESNLLNGMMILGFTLFGGLLAYVLMAFRWSWGRGFLLLLAMGLSCAVFVGLAGSLEKMRLEQ